MRTHFGLAPGFVPHLDDSSNSPLPENPQHYLANLKM